MTTNTNLISMAKAPSRQIYVKASFDDGDGDSYDYTGSNNVISVSIDQEYCSGGLNFGQTSSAQCTLTMYNPIYDVTPHQPIFVGQRFWISAGFYNGNAIGAFENIGEFIVDSITSSDSWKTITITGYDKLALLNVEYEPAIVFPASAEAIYGDILGRYLQPLNITSRLGVNKNASSSDDVGAWTQTMEYIDGTVRDYLGYIAGLMGANVIMDKNFLVFSRPVYSNGAENGFTIERDIQYMGATSLDNESLFTIQSIVTGTADNVIVSGSGASITYTCPFATQASTDALLTQVKGLSYYPLSCEWRGCPGVQAGDTCYVEFEEDVLVPTIVMTQNITIEGGLKSTITAPETKLDVAVMESSAQREVNAVYGLLNTAIKNATEKINGANGGVFVIDDDNHDGVNDGWHISDGNTGYIKASVGGIGISNNGGNTYKTAMTAEGINADVITVGQMSASRVQVNGNTLDDYLNIGRNADDKIQVTIGASNSDIRLAIVNDKLAFIDSAGNVKSYFTNNSFEIDALKVFRLGRAKLVVQGNGSISLTKAGD